MKRPMCLKGGDPDEVFSYDDGRFTGDKWRGSKVRDCAYDSNGYPKRDPAQTCNFFPYTGSPDEASTMCLEGGDCCFCERRVVHPHRLFAPVQSRGGH